MSRSLLHQLPVSGTSRTDGDRHLPRRLYSVQTRTACRYVEPVADFASRILSYSTLRLYRTQSSVRVQLDRRR